MTTLVRTLHLDYDLIEIHFNSLLKNKPYLVKIYNWNNTESEELRLNQEEIDNLYKVLKESNFL